MPGSKSKEGNPAWKEVKGRKKKKEREPYGLIWEAI